MRFFRCNINFTEFMLLLIIQLMIILLYNCSVEDDICVTAAVQAAFSDKSLTTYATGFLKPSKKLHSSTASDVSSMILIVYWVC